MRLDPKDLGAPPGEAGMVDENLMAMVFMEDMVVMEHMGVMEDMDGGIVRKVVRARRLELFL